MNGSKHSLASVLALLVVPGVLMLNTAFIGRVLHKPPAKHLVVVLAVGVMWHSMGRRWLEKYPAAADKRLSGRCLFTLFVMLPAAHLLAFAWMGVDGDFQSVWVKLAFAALLGVYPLYTFYFNELKV